MTQKVTSYYNIFKCGRNISDQLDVTYQKAFTATPEDEYYKEMMKSLIKANNECGKLCNEKIRQTFIDLRAEFNGEYKHNINNISCDDLYQSPMKKKDVSTINDLVYYESDEHVDTISDSSKQVEASNNPIKETHIFNGINNLSVGVVSVEPAVIGVGIIGQGTTQGVINGGMGIGSNLVTNVLTNSSKILFDTNTFQLNTLQSDMLVIGPQDGSTKSNNRIIYTPSDSRKIRGKHISRIDTPGVNKDIWSVIDKT